MNSDQARQLAAAAIERAQMDDHEIVNGTVYAGLNSDGYWVTDNGEEVNGLSKEQAVEIIVENLTAE